MPFEQIPYTNFHGTNQDWMIQQIKQMIADWASYRENLDTAWAAYQDNINNWRQALDAAFTELHTYVHDYFDNLDVQLEINNKLDEFLEDGTLDSILLPYFNTYTTEINNTVNTQNNRITLLESEMDAFLQSHPATTGEKDAELVDIRVGYNGETYPTAGDAVRGQIVDVMTDLSYFEDTQAKRYYPTWETGNIDETTGINVDGNYTRCTEYIDKSVIVNFTVNTHTGSLYVYRYNYDATTGEYTYLGHNQITQYADFTSWLKGLDGTHFRIRVGAVNAKPDNWLYVGINNTVNTNITQATDNALNALNAFNTLKGIRYWRHDYTVESGATHRAVRGEVPVLIPSGHKFSIKEKTNINFGRQFYVYYSDGTDERIYSYSPNLYNYFSRNFVVQPKEKDITSFSVYINNAQGTVTDEISIEIFVEKSLSEYDGYPYQTNYYITNEDSSITCFEVGRPRSLVQAIAVVNNEVWEFAQGKAYYNGTEYTLNNGHGNNCNWGTALHGTYPYLYCPTWIKDEMNINVFSFDGTTFTQVNTIHFEGYTGYLNAYIDEPNDFIYAFIFSDNAAGKCHYLVSDLSGNVLFEKDLPYLIRTIQGICMHDGLIYAVSGFGNEASPNYLYKISPDGTLISKNVMGAIGHLGEIEGIDFLDNEMILATYYSFYIHPHRVPQAARKGYLKQLEASE